MLKHLLIGATALTLTTPAWADYDLTILHTNDFHARFEPVSKYDGICKPEDNDEGECFGGTARLITAIQNARARADNTLLLDGGDQFQGTLFYTYYKGSVAAEMMNKLGYDGMTVGNHEFDDGPTVLRDFVNTVDFPILMSNADITMEPALAGLIEKSVIIEKAGQRIGMIGLTPIDTDELASPGKNITFSDPVAAVQGEVDKMTAQGVNKIIVLSHSGYSVDLRVAEQTTGVDVIVGGHSNTLLSNVNDRAVGPYPTMVGDTAIVQAYAYGKFLGELNLRFDDAGRIISAVGEPLVMDAAVAEDGGIKGRIAELATPLEEIRTRIVAQSSALIDVTNCRMQECELGNLVADAMLDRVADQGVSIAIANGGGIRASIDAGDVTMGDVLTVLPFQNTLATFEITGAGVIAGLENGVSQVEESKGRFPQVAGLRFSFSRGVAPNEGRISSVEVMENGAWVAIDESKVYNVVTNNYVRNGGDGYKVFSTDGRNAYDFGADLADVVAEYMAAQSGGYKPYLDGRIEER